MVSLHHSWILTACLQQLPMQLTPCRLLYMPCGSVHRVNLPQTGLVGMMASMHLQNCSVMQRGP